MNQVLLALIISVYLGFRLLRGFSRERSLAGVLLLGFMSSITLFSLLLFLEASLLPSERLLVVFLENTVLAASLVMLIQFAYCYPRPKSSQNIERWIALLLSLAYMVWEASVAVHRFSLLREGQVEFRIEMADLGPLLLFGWVVFLFVRSSIQNWGDAATRRFALVFIIPLWLAGLNILRSYYEVSTQFFQLNMSVGILIILFTFSLNYIISLPEQTSFTVKFSGAILTAVLALFGAVSWLVAPIYSSQYIPAIQDRRSLLFLPNEAGGYDVSETPYHFETDLGENLQLVDDKNKLTSKAIDFHVSFFGNVYETVYISNDGMLGIGEDLKYQNVQYRFTRTPAIFPLLVDFDPENGEGSGVFFRREADYVIITYNHVKAFYYPELVYTFQVVLYSSGKFEITYESLPDDLRFFSDDRPDAVFWAVGVKPAHAPRESVNYTQLPINSGPEGAIQDEYRHYREYMHRFLLPLAVAVLAGSLFLLAGLPPLMVYGLGRPLNRLIRGVQGFNSGKLGEDIRVTTNDEIGYLTQSFNRLGNELGQLIGSLEERILARTADLTATNNELHKLTIALEQSPSAIIITNPQVEIEYVNPAFTDVTGYRPEEVYGKKPGILKAGKTPVRTFNQMWRALSAGKIWRGELCNCRKNGEMFWMYAVIAPIRDELGNTTNYVSIQEDITSRKLAEEALSESEKQYRDLFELESDAIFIIRNLDGAILEANSAASDMYGYTHEQLLGLCNEDLSAEKEATRDATQSPVPVDKIVAIPHRWHVKKDGTVFPVEISARFITWKGEKVHVAAIRDGTERYRVARELENLAITDSLTGLYNRRHFFKLGEEVFDRSLPEHGTLAVLMMDMDYFKQVNDQYGHAVGDVVLKEAARRVKFGVRPTDLLGRYGGEEFVAILPRTNVAEACHVADRLVHLMNEKPIIVGGLKIKISISIGVAVMGQKTPRLDDLLSNADVVLYAAKKAGRNRWTLWDENQEGWQDISRA